MNRYVVSEELKSKLTGILDKVKSGDRGLIFVISIENEPDGYLIYVPTTFEIHEANRNYVGFFFVKEKTFLIFENTPEEFLTFFSRESILIAKKRNTGQGKIVEPYIDELPYSIFRYHKGKFTDIYSSY